ncbi:MAG: hypothetical protein K6E51_07775 [Treponema sp.]|nr:hypothetical protein [Treponema sp.]
MSDLVTQTLRIVHAPDESNPFIILVKPSGIPSAPLSASDTTSALSIAATLYPEIKTVKNHYKDIEYGLLHRIDTATEGLLLIATTQQAYQQLLQSQAKGRFIKEYTATCTKIFEQSDGFEGFDEEGLALRRTFEHTGAVSIQSFFRPYGKGRKQVRPVPIQTSRKMKHKDVSQKLYTTQIRLLSDSDHQMHVVCTLTEGYRHQVRTHLAWMRLPISGDPLYNPYTSDTGEPAPFLFKATGLTFEHPLTGEKLSYHL